MPTNPPEPGDDRRPADALLSATIYDRLRGLAGHMMRAEKFSHTLQPTALIHEAYLKIAAQDRTIVDDEHFLALAATQMRRVLIDFARAKHSQKRNPEGDRVLLQGNDDLAAEVAALEQAAGVDVLILEEALHKLHALSPQQAKIVELRFFGGLSVSDIASALDTSDRTVAREWALAKTFLQRALKA
ncbi:MAG: RNA polymerase sigma-70 factor (ECF subfamily) [Pseudohongiellaceae bacterium]|jgi:RNA polymerase sigma-70 factor (ECF subfamily)